MRSGSRTARCGRRSPRPPWRRDGHPGPGSSGRSRRRGPPAPAGPLGPAGATLAGGRPSSNSPMRFSQTAVGRRWPAAGWRSGGWCRPWPDQIVTGTEVFRRPGPAVTWSAKRSGQPWWPARAKATSSSRAPAASGLAGGPALQQPQEGGRAQVVTGDLQRGREGRDQVRPQPVQQPALVAGGPLVVAGDRPQLRGHRPVRDQRPQRGEPVQRQQASDPGVFGVVLLPGRATAAG